LLEFLEVVFVGAALDEVVDVEQVAFGRDVEPGILLPDAAVSPGRVGAGRGVGPHPLGTGACVHLLLVEGHPVRVGVGREGLLRGWVGEDGGGADVGVEGEAVVGHLLRWVGGKGGGTKVAWTKGVQGLGTGGGACCRVVGDGPRVLAVGGGLVGGQTGKRVVALLGEEGVVAVGVDDGAGGGTVDEVGSIANLLPDGRGDVGREDGVGAGGGRHEDGGVEDGAVEGGVVVQGEDGRFPVHGADGGG